MTEMTRVMVVRLVKVPSFGVVVVNEDLLNAGSAWTDTSTA